MPKITRALTAFLMVVSIVLFCTTSFAGTTTYIYDELDRLKEVQFGDGNGIKYEYDEIGNLKSKTPTGNVFSITASAGEGGGVFPTGTLIITAGSSKSYSIVPLFGCHIVDVAVDGVPQGAITNYTFTNLGANHTISASFSNTFNITAIAGIGGTVTPTSATVNYGGSQAFTITTDIRYQIADVKVDGVSQGAVTSYTFSNINAGHALEVSFALSSCANPPVKIARATPLYFSTLQAAYDAAVSGDIISSQAQVFVENLTANRDIAVTLDGGYSCDYSFNPDKTTIKGMPRTSSGTVTMKNFRISN